MSLPDPIIGTALDLRESLDAERRERDAQAGREMVRRSFRFRMGALMRLLPEIETDQFDAFLAAVLRERTRRLALAPAGSERARRVGGGGR